MAVQTNRNFMTAADFQKRFPNLYNQQLGQKGAFGAPLGSGTPYQSTTPAGAAPAAPLDITSPLNLGAGVYGNASTPSNLATSMYGDAALGTLPGDQTAQPAFGNIAQPITQTGQAAFGNIAQPLTASSLAEEVVGLDGKKVDANNSGMTDQMIEQLQVAEDARFKQVVREEEAKKLAAELAEEERKREEAAAEARLTPEQRLEKYTPKLQEQILGQQLTDKWRGGYGPQDSSRDIAKILAGAGITDIRQFGKIKKTVPDTDAEGNPTTREVEVFGNKVTGQEIEKRSGRWQRQGGSDLFAGTGLGDGNTGYRVQFTDDGTPVFYTTKGSSSDLYKLAPILAVASFIPALAPFAQGLNALIALKQKNILGALGSFAGLGSQLSGLSGISGQLSNISNAANFASAAKNKNILGMLSAGANLGGTDLDGLAKASGIGDVTGLAGLNLGGLGVSDALKAYRTVQAVKSGDPTSMIYALGGYAKDAANRDQNEKGFASAADITRSLAGKQGTPERFERFDLPSVDDDFASSYGLGRLPDDLSALLPELPSIDEDFPSTYALPSIDEDFPRSFAEATPRQVAKAAARQRTYDSVGGGRGGQGGATAEQLARANAVRGNPPQGDVARFVSSLFPSAEAGSVPSGRGQDSASQIPGYSGRAPASTYDEQNSIFGRAADALGLPQEFQRNVSNTLSALPGVNMPIGAVRGVNAASRVAGAADEAGAAKYFDEAGRYIPGSNAYKAPEYASLPTRMTADPMMMFKMIQDLPNDVYKTPAVQNALKAIVDGDGVAAFKALESNPAAKKELLKYAEKMGAQEVSLYKNLDRYELPNPAKYTQRTGGGYNTRKKAEGGLMSLTKRQMSKA